MVLLFKNIKWYIVTNLISQPSTDSFFRRFHLNEAVDNSKCCISLLQGGLFVGVYILVVYKDMSGCEKRDLAVSERWMKTP